MKYKQIKKEIHHLYEYLSFITKTFKKEIKFNFSNDENSILFSTIICKFDSPTYTGSLIETLYFNIFCCFDITNPEYCYQIDSNPVYLKIKNKFISFLCIKLNINNPFKKILKKIMSTDFKTTIEKEFNNKKNKLKDIANKLNIPYSFWVPCDIHTKDLWTIINNESIKKDNMILYQYINNYHLDESKRKMMIFFNANEINLNNNYEENITKAYFQIFPHSFNSIENRDGNYYTNFLNLESVINANQHIILNKSTYFHLNNNYKNKN